VKLQTLFEPVSLWQFGPFTVVRTKEQKKLIRRLYNAEVGFDYSVRREIPRIQGSRDSHRDNAQRLKAEVAELKKLSGEAEAMRGLLDEAFDFLGGVSGASELRGKMLPFLASGIEAPSADETGSGSTEGESPTGKAGDAQNQSASRLGEGL
jgi:hypothetical protein